LAKILTQDRREEMSGLPFQIRGGKKIGREHARWGKNCQDGYAFKKTTILGQDYLIGAVADGCGQGENSEVAGIMSSIFVVNQVQHLLRYQMPIIQIPAALYPSVVGFLEAIRKQIPFKDSQEIVGFIQNYLLATILGFVIGEDKGVVFHAGDGLIAINEEILAIEYDNVSPYLGYHLVPQSALQGGTLELPRTFAVQFLDVATLDKLAIASDGFSKSLLRRMWHEAEPVSLGIQLWMNWINGPRNPSPETGLFYDDAAVVVVERIKEDGNA